MKAVKHILSYAVLAILLTNQVPAQTGQLQCETTHSKPGFDTWVDLVEHPGGGYFATVAESSDTWDTVVNSLLVKFRRMKLYRLSANCDTVYSKTYDIIGYGGLGKIIKLHDNLYVTGGFKYNLTSPSISNYYPIALSFDSMGILQQFVEFPQFIGTANRILQAPSGSLYFVGMARYGPLTGDGRLFIAKTYTSLNVEWVKIPLDLGPAYVLEPLDAVWSNDGCLQVLASEGGALFGSGITRPRILTLDPNGDTIRTKRIEIPGIGDTFLLTKLSIYQHNRLYANGYSLFTSLGFSGYIVQFDESLQVQRQFTRFNNIPNLFLTNQGSSFVYTMFSSAGIPHRNAIATMDSSFLSIDSSFVYAQDSNYIEPFGLLLEDTTLLIAGYRLESGVTQAQDLYISRYAHQYGPVYKHDYCGGDWPAGTRKRTLVGFTTASTTDSLYFTDTSVATLACAPDIYKHEWSITGYGSFTTPDVKVIRLINLDTLDVQLVVSNFFGCTDTLQAKVLNSTGQVLSVNTEEVTAPAANVQVYPNPAGDWIRVVLPEGSAEGLWQLHNAKGQLVQIKPLGQAEQIVSLTDLPEGLYGYSIVTDKGYFTGRLVVARY